MQDSPTSPGPPIVATDDDLARLERRAAELGIELNAFWALLLDVR